MKSIVLKPFDYSFDGIRALKALVDQKIDFLDMTEGLTAEGYVAPTEDDEPVEVVVADDDVTPDPVVETQVTEVEPVPEVVTTTPVVEPTVVVEPVVEVTPDVAPARPAPRAKRR